MEEFLKILRRERVSVKENMINKLRNEVCDVIKSQASFWLNTNDIKSPTHLCDIEEGVNSIDGLNEVDSEELVELLSRLYWFVRKL